MGSPRPEAGWPGRVRYIHKERDERRPHRPPPTVWIPCDRNTWNLSVAPPAQCWAAARCIPC